MEASEQDIDLIDRYLREELTGAELEAFEKRRAAEPEFDQEVLFMEGLVQAGSNAIQEKELREKLKKIEQEYLEIRGAAASAEPEKGILDSAIEWLGDIIQIRPAYSSYAIAASIALLMGFSFVLYYSIYRDMGGAFVLDEYMAGKETTVKSVELIDLEPGLGTFRHGATDTSTSITKKTIPVVFVDDDEYSHSYYLRDTLYLFDVGNNVEIFNYIKPGKAQVIIKLNTDYYSIQPHYRDTLLPLTLIEDSVLLEKLRNYEN